MDRPKAVPPFRFPDYPASTVWPPVATLQEAVAQEIEKNACRIDVDLSQLAIDAFFIDVMRWPHMLVAFECYSAFKCKAGEMPPFYAAFPPQIIEQGRAQHSRWCAVSTYGLPEFEEFSREMAGLSRREAHTVWYWSRVLQLPDIDMPPEPNP